MHYLSYCQNKNIEKRRNDFIDNIKGIQPQLRHFENNNIIKYCLNMNDHLIFKPFSDFINNILSTSKDEEEKIHNVTTHSYHIM